MNNIFTNGQKPVKHIGRNGFDLSSFHAFSMRPSVVRPVFVQATVPDSSFKINVSDLVRTSALQTAAFVAGKQDLDVFFVPYRQLYSVFDSVVFGRDDLQSPKFTGMDNTELPVTQLYDLLLFGCDIAVLSLAFVYSLKKNFGNSPSQVWASICDAWVAGYDPSDHSDQPSQDFLLRYCFFDDITLNDINNWTFNTLHPVGFSVLQHLSTLGYSDFGQRLDNLMSASRYYGASSLQELNTSITEIVNAYRYFLSSAADITVSLMPCAAYQKVWREYYRDTILDDDPSYLYASNLDMVAPTELYYIVRQVTSSTLDSLLRTSWINMLMPRLHQYKKDLNTGLWSSYNYPIDNIINGDYEYPLTSDVASSSIIEESLVPAAQSQANNAYAIKYVLAMQKYAESLMRAGNRTKDLLMSEFGVKSKFVNNTYCEHLGSFSGRLDINKVAATSESGSYSVGDLAANMFTSLQGSEIDFTCNDYGVIIGVLSFVPEIVENAFGINPQNLKSKQLDFYHADFENLGLVPVDQANFDIKKHGTTHGYGARYYEYKQNLDLAHDSFVSCPIDKQENFDSQFDNPDAFDNSGVDSNYIITKNNVQALSTSKKRSYMLPDVMDNIFVTQDSGHVDSNHFKVGMNVEITAVLPMSVTGMM